MVQPSSSEKNHAWLQGCGRGPDSSQGPVGCSVTLKWNIYVDPFPKEVRRAGERFKIELGQKVATGPFWG